MVIEADINPKSMASSMDNIIPRTLAKDYDVMSTVAAADAMLKLSASYMSPVSHLSASSDGVEGSSVISVSDGSDNEVRSRSSSMSRRERKFVPEMRKDESYWLKRRKNNEAAKRSREKRRLNDMVLNDKVQQVTQENNELKKELEAIKQHFGLPLHQPFSPPTNTSNGLPQTSYGGKEMQYQRNSGNDYARINGSLNNKSVVSQEDIDHAAKQFLQQQRQLLTAFPSTLGSINPVVIAPKENHLPVANMFMPLLASTSQSPLSQEIMDYHKEKVKDTEQRNSALQSHSSGSSPNSALLQTTDDHTVQGIMNASRKRKLSQMSHSDEEESTRQQNTRESPNDLKPYQHMDDALASSSGSSSSSGNGGSPVSDHSNTQKGIPHKLRHKFAHLSELSGTAAEAPKDDVIMAQSINGRSSVNSNECKEHTVIKHEENWSDSEYSDSLTYDSDPNNIHSNSSCSSYEDKRKRNNEAARKCREKKRFLMNIRRVQSEYLETENSKLKKELKMLSNEVSNLKDLMETKRMTEEKGGVFHPPPIEILKKQLLQRSEAS